MSIADEIRKAMAELNLNTEDVPTTDPEPEKEKEPEQEYTLTKDDQLVKLTPAERLIMKQQQELDNPQPEPEPQPEPTPEPVKKPKAPKSPKPQKPKKEKTQPVINVEPKVAEYKPSEPVQERPHTEPKPIQEAPQKSPAIYMKVAGDKLVVMIPDGVELESHNINGESVRAAVVSLPDLSDNELQVLGVINKVETEPVKHTVTQQPAVYVTQEPTPKAEFDVRAVADPNWTPDQATPIQSTTVQTKTEQVKFEKPVKKIEKPKTEKPKPVVVPDENLNLDDLLEEKKTLTAEIKEAREAGDTERVNMLRRQRRVVRAKIHQFGG